VSSILDDVKHALGLLPDQPAFDSDVKMHINTALGTLNQLGIGPSEGFMIADSSAQWSEFIPNARQNGVTSYLFLRVKLLLDPPQVGFVIASMDRQIQELEWRLMVEASPAFISPDVVIDGGGA
jgi:hypothetical protein